MNAQVDRHGVLTYGSVELCLSELYPTGDTLVLDQRIRLQIVDCVEKADGIVILGLVPRDGEQRPSCLCLLYTHYYCQPDKDLVDHVTTLLYLSDPAESLRLLTELVVTNDLARRCPTAALIYSPKVQFL